MKHFFVPMDGSACAGRALEYAITLARSLGECTIHIAHAHEEPLIYGDIAVYVPREKIDALQRQQSESVLAEPRSRLEAAGIPCTQEILVGPLGEVLAERASALGCEAIVMGTHGRSALANVLMGSVATKVIHFSRLPVTLVK